MPSSFFRCARRTIDRCPEHLCRMHIAVQGWKKKSRLSCFLPQSKINQSNRSTFLRDKAFFLRTTRTFSISRYEQFNDAAVYRYVAKAPGKRIDHQFDVLPVVASNSAIQAGDRQTPMRRNISGRSRHWQCFSFFRSNFRRSVEVSIMTSIDKWDSRATVGLCWDVDACMSTHHSDSTADLANRSRRTNRDWRFEQIVFLVSPLWRPIRQCDASDSLFAK